MDRLAEAPRDLLLGLLALQNGLISQAQLVAAFQAWTQDRTRALSDMLVGQRALSAAQCDLLESLAEAIAHRDHGSAERSIARLASSVVAPPVRAEVAAPGSDALWSLVGETPPLHEIAGNTTITATGELRSDKPRFRILRSHARGGLGVVYVAHDEELHREVALKQILDEHADNSASRARFVMEAEITGGLEHPSIVPVYGLGQYPDGRPYYAMRLIRGDSLKDAIVHYHRFKKSADDGAAASLGLRDLLGRFIAVCNAIEYAHGRGVVHRDVKPSNVMVGKHGETLVLDWGLAKAVGRPDPSLTSDEQTLVPASKSGPGATLPGSALGTPAYMSPEQACGDIANVGPRSDVYSLGATLYYLLTGQPPFDEKDVEDVRILEAVRRGAFMPPRQVDRTIDPALEAICLKAMAVRSDQRYASPRALADDIERWMADEPVSARPEPSSERLRRWVRRRRTVVAVLAASVVVAMAGLGTVLAVQARANRDLRISNARERARFDLAMEAIRTFHSGVSEDVLMRQKEFDDLRGKLLHGARDFYRKLEQLLEGERDRRSRAALGRAYFELGDLTEKIGSKEESLAVHLRALAVRQALLDEHPDDVELQAEVGRSLLARGMLLSLMGKMTEARASYQRAQAIFDTLVAAEPNVDAYRADLAACYHRLGNLLAETGHPDEAVKQFDSAISARVPLAASDRSSPEVKRDLAWSYSNLGNILWAIGRPAQALAAHEKARLIREPLARANPDTPQLQSGLASTYDNIGSLLSASGRVAEGMQAHEKALAIRVALAEAYPTVTAFQRDLASCHASIGNLLAASGKSAEALAAHRRALVIREALPSSDPDLPRLQSDLAFSHADIGSLLLATGHPAEALTEHERALAIREALAESHPSILSLQRDLATSYHALGDLYAATGRSDDALAAYARAIKIREPLARANPSLTRFQNDLAGCHAGIGDVFMATHRPKDALTAYAKAIAIRDPLVQGHPTIPAFRLTLAQTLKRTGIAQSAVGAHADAVALYRRGVGVLEQLANRSGRDLYDLACCHARLAASAALPGSGLSAADGALEGDRAMECLRNSVDAGFRNLVAYTNNADLDAIRSRSDFQRLLAELKSTPGG
jgi:serine/threonine-protein kinase